MLCFLGKPWKFWPQLRSKVTVLVYEGIIEGAVVQYTALPRPLYYLRYGQFYEKLSKNYLTCNSNVDEGSMYVVANSTH